MKPLTNRVPSYSAARSRVSKFSPALSGLRGLASLGVVLFHETNAAKWPFITFPADAFTYSLFLGVPIFLMMSMYLLLNRLDANSDLKHYFKRRIIRIWPIYYGTLVVAYLIFRFPFWAFVRYLFFVEYYVNPSGYFPVAVFWTLQLEEAVYLIIPIIHKIRLKNWLGYGIILGGFSYLSWVTLFAAQAPPRDTISYLQQLLPISLIGYGFGILAYTGIIYSKRMRWLSVAGILGYFLMNYYYSGSLIYNSASQYFIYNVLLYGIALTGFAFVVANPPKFLGWFTFFGEESYALYAIHLAFVVLFGLPGLFYAIGLAFVVEFAARPKEMMRRLSSTYSALIRPKRAYGGSTTMPIPGNDVT